MTAYWLSHVLHILDTIVQMREELERCDPGTNYLVRQGICYSLQTIAESAHKLPQDVKKKHSSVNWIFWRELRNELAHDYLDTPSWTRMKGIIDDDVAVLFGALESQLPDWRSL